MSRWLVTHVPSWLLLAVLMTVIAGGAVLIGWGLRRRFPRLAQEDHNDALRFIYGVVAFVYAFFVGFLANSLWSQITAADASVRAEGSAGVQLARDRTVFDNLDADRIRQSLLEYHHAAIAEWPVAARGGISPEADQALRNLYQTYEDLQPRTDIQKSFLARSLINLDTMSQRRTDRLIEADVDAGPTWPLWAVIFVTSGLVLGCAIAFGIESPRMHSGVVIIIGVLVAANLFLILELSYPYLGDVGISTEPLQVAIRALG